MTSRIRADLHVPDDFAERLDELADTCDRLVDACRETGSRGGDLPDPASQIALESRQFREDFPDASKNLEFAPAQAATSYADSIRLQLAGISALLRTREIVGTLWPLVRAELETAGRVAWLLEPSIEQPAGIVRVARYYLEVISSLQRQRMTTGKYDRGAEKFFKSQRDATIGAAKRLFPDLDFDMSTPEAIGGWSLSGESMAGLGASANLFGQHFLTGPSKALYDILSDYSHPSLVSIELQSRLVDDGKVATRPRVATVEEVEHQVRWACVILYQTCRLVCRYLGIDGDELEEWADNAPSHWFNETPN